LAEIDKFQFKKQELISLSFVTQLVPNINWDREWRRL